MKRETEEIRVTPTPNNITFDQDDISTTHKDSPDRKEPLKLIPASDLNSNDVLCGRGMGTNRNQGNKRFRELVSMHQEAYLSAKILEKSLIAEKIVEMIKSRTPPGRFLKNVEGNLSSEKDTMWCEISDRAAKEKTSQALRERAPELRKKSAQQSSTSPLPDGMGRSSPPSPLVEMSIAAPAQCVALFNSPSSAFPSPSQTPSDVPSTGEICDEPSTLDINDNDVLCGRGGVTNLHAGNCRFRELVKSYQPVYLAAPKMEKADIARKLVQIVRNANPPGRFLQQNGEKGRWYDIGDEKAREKTSQALREKAPEVRSLYSAAASLVDTKGEALRPEYSRQVHLMPSAEEYCEYGSPEYNNMAVYFSPMRIHGYRNTIGCSPTRVTTIKINDVILGRGSEAKHHLGNIRFRDIVKSRLAEYLKASKQDKSSIVRAIVETVRNSNPPGRFLADDPNRPGVFTDVGDERAREKTSQALRDCPCPSPTTSINQEGVKCYTPQNAQITSSYETVKAGGERFGKAVGDITPSEEVTANDVLLGRGAGVNYHPGNRRFRELVSQYRSAYLTAAKLEKASIARKVVDIIRTSSTPPGRFLSKDPERPGGWVEVSEERAREKASQALREQISKDSEAKRPHSLAGDSPSSQSVLSERNEGSAYNVEYNQYSYIGREFHPYRHFPSEPEKFDPVTSWMYRSHLTMPGNPFLHSSPGVRPDEDSPMRKRRRFNDGGSL